MAKLLGNGMIRIVSAGLIVDGALDAVAQTAMRNSVAAGNAGSEKNSELANSLQTPVTRRPDGCPPASPEGLLGLLCQDALEPGRFASSTVRHDTLDVVSG